MCLRMFITAGLYSRLSGSYIMALKHTLLILTICAFCHITVSHLCRDTILIIGCRTPKTADEILSIQSLVMSACRELVPIVFEREHAWSSFCRAAC